VALIFGRCLEEGAPLTPLKVFPTLTLFHSSGPTAGKLEIRISKLETNPNVQNEENVQNTDGSRTSRLEPSDLTISNLFRISSFEFRIWFCLRHEKPVGAECGPDSDCQMSTSFFCAKTAA
jgi:hypothetical protein